MHLLVGEFSHVKDLWNIRYHALVMLVKRLPCLWKLKINCPVVVRVVAQHRVPQTAVTVQWIFYLWLVLRARNVTAEVHLLQLDQLLELLYFSLLEANLSHQVFIVLILLSQLFVKLLLHRLLFWFYFLHLSQFQLQDLYFWVCISRYCFFSLLTQFFESVLILL